MKNLIFIGLILFVYTARSQTPPAGAEISNKTAADATKSLDSKPAAENANEGEKLIYPVVVKTVGDYYLVGKKEGKPLFVQTSEVTKTSETSRTTKSFVVDADGKVAVTEEATVVDGMIVSQVMDQLQINERYTLEIKDKQITMKSFAIEGTTYKLKEDKSFPLTAEFVTGPSIETKLAQNRGVFNLENKKGKINVEFGIFEVMKPIDFTMKRTKTIFDEKLVAVAIEINSFWLSPFVDSLHAEYDPKTFTMLRYRGRTPVRILKNKKWANFDADIYFQKM